MPSRTLLYLIWRGTPAADARKTNSLLALWDDPDFAPVRSAMFENMMSAADKDASKQALTREEVEKYSALLDNALVLGYHRQARSQRLPAPFRRKPAEHPWNGLVPCLRPHRQRKTAQRRPSCACARQEKDVPQLSQITVAGVPALKVERPTGTTYWVEHGKYAASANERSVLEEILARLEGKAPAGALAGPVPGLPGSPAPPRRRLAGVLWPTCRTSRLSFRTPTPPASKIAPVLDAMKLDAVHSFCGRVILEGAKTRVQAALLGDTATGTLFDLWGAGQQSPVSLSLLPPNAISYSETQFNLPGFYEMLKHAITAALPPGQQGTIAMIGGPRRRTASACRSPTRSDC